MILPHLKPIRFAQNIIEVNEKTSLVQCEFPVPPTLAMFCEAAAQSSASYNQQTSSKDEQIGFLVTLKNAKILKETTDKVFDIKLNKKIELGNMSEYSFEVIKNNTLYATGTFTIVLP